MKQVSINLENRFTSESQVNSFYERMNYLMGAIEGYPVDYGDHFRLEILIEDNGVRVLSEHSESLHEGFLYEFPIGGEIKGVSILGAPESLEAFAFREGSVEDGVAALRIEECHTLVLAGSQGIPEYLIIKAMKIKAAMPEINIAIRDGDGDEFCRIVNIM